jgi:hypothetical protein
VAAETVEMRRLFVLAIAALLASALRAVAQGGGDAPHAHAMGGMDMDAGGMVMNQNPDRLPRDCPRISGEAEIMVRAGRKYAAGFPGTMFGYDQRQWNVAGCARVRVTLINEDHVRHQWMLHGLPRYLYPEGMFHLEVAGPGRRSGTFIVPSAAKTYLVHCDVPQHTEKGMKAELKVAGGDGDLPSIPGVSAPIRPDAYALRWSARTLLVIVAAASFGAVVAFAALRR